MWRSKRQKASQLDRLIAGESVPEMGDGLVELVDRLRAEPDQRETPADLVTTLATEASQAESAPSGTRNRTPNPLPTRWRRRTMLTTFLSSLIGKLAIGTVALATTTGGLAATGNLPDPVQDWASEQLGTIGVEIPEGEEPEVEVEGDRSSDVLDVIEGTDPEDRDQEFGEDVADTASEGASTEGRTRAEDGAENAGENDDIAEDVTEDAGDVELPEESESGADSGEQGDAFRP